MDPAIISIAVGIAVIFGISMLLLVFGKSPSTLAEERLDDIHGRSHSAPRDKASRFADLVKQPTDVNLSESILRHLPKIDSLGQLFEQADVAIKFEVFLIIIAALAALGALTGVLIGLPTPLLPVSAMVSGFTPVLWLKYRKRARIKQFLDAMPEAMELMGRALRAGHGLASGMHLVSEEMKGPIALEFGRVFEEQNLGIPVDVSLRAMADRIPAMDVRFFVTAVIIQRSTGGDLAEVLDKIGKLIRQRFELFGHVKALTAEGRLSGVVLLAMPPSLLAFLSMINPNYMGVLYKTAVGHKMLLVTAGLQIMGALMIKKIVSIKV